MAADNKDPGRAGGGRRPPEVAGGAAPGASHAVQVGADTLSVGGDLVIANQLQIQGPERQEDPRLGRWLQDLARFERLGLVGKWEYEEFCAWAAGEAPAEGGPLADEVDASILAPSPISSPAQARRRQILVALRLNQEPRIEILGMSFFLVPPGRSQDGRHCNQAAFFLAQTLVSESLWARVLGEGGEGARGDRAKVGISRRKIEGFLEAAQRHLDGRARIDLPAPANLVFAEAISGGVPTSRHRRVGAPQLGTTAPSSLGFQDLSGVVYQLCRDGEAWSWWGGSFATPPRRSSEAAPCLPSRSTFEEGPEFGFRPLLYPDYPMDP